MESDIVVEMEEEKVEVEEEAIETPKVQVQEEKIAGIVISSNL